MLLLWAAMNGVELTTIMARLLLLILHTVYDRLVPRVQTGIGPLSSVRLDPTARRTKPKLRRSDVWGGTCQARNDIYRLRDICLTAPHHICRSMIVLRARPTCPVTSLPHVSLLCACVLLTPSSARLIARFSSPACAEWRPITAHQEASLN